MIRSFLRTLVGLFFLSVVLVAGAQIVPVTPAASPVSEWVVGVAVLLALAVGGFFWLKKHRPSQAAAFSAATANVGHEALTSAHNTIERLAEHIVALKAPAPAVAAAEAPAVAAAPVVATAVVATSGSDETPIAWAARTAALTTEADLAAFDEFSRTQPASRTYADVLTLFKAHQAAAAQ
jgi:hypothetical protein